MRRATATTVLIDARLAGRGLGIGTFVERLLEGFAALGSPAPRPWGLAHPGPGAARAALGRSGLFDLAPRLDPRAAGHHVVHYAANVGPLWPGPRSVLTVHDLLAGRRARDLAFSALRGRALGRVGRVVAVSARTGADIEERFPALRGRVTVIPHGLRRLVAPTGPRTHLLGFGGLDPRKRVGLLVEAYGRYRATTSGALPLVVLARAGLAPAQRRALAALGARVVPDATRAQADALMAGAAALVYPTAEEGFGLPVLEAAEVATPVVIDRGARLAGEVVGDHCLAVDGSSVEAWAAGMRRAVEGGPVAAALDLPGWHEVAAAYRDLYDEVA